MADDILGVEGYGQGLGPGEGPQGGMLDRESTLLVHRPPLLPHAHIQDVLPFFFLLQPSWDWSKEKMIIHFHNTKR